MVQQQDIETRELADALGITDPARMEKLNHVARGYSDAVGIIDALRIQGWSEDGLTIPQMRLLWSLRDEDGLPVGALAEQLGVNPSTITGHVDRLVRQDLVRREEDPTTAESCAIFSPRRARSRSARCAGSSARTSSTSSSGWTTTSSCGWRRRSTTSTAPLRKHAPRPTLPRVRPGTTDFTESPQ